MVYRLVSVSKTDVRLERKLQYEFMQLNSKDLMRSLYRTRYARLDVSQLSNVLTAYAVVGHSTVNGPYTPVRTGGGARWTAD